MSRLSFGKHLIWQNGFHLVLAKYKFGYLNKKKLIQVSCYNMYMCTYV